MEALRYVYDDGGRKAAGFTGQAPGDCVVRAFAIATGLPYREVYDTANYIAKTSNRTVGRTFKRGSARSGIHRRDVRDLAEIYDFAWTATMGIGTGCKVHMRADELPSGIVVLSVTRHVVAVIDHMIHDTFDPSRNGTRCVYGYWSRP